MDIQAITCTYHIGGSPAMNIDVNGKEYLVQWSKSIKSPDLSRFPQVEDAIITAIPHSAGVQKLWSESKVLKYGGDGHIRVLESCKDDFPICKVAIDERQRYLLRGEFSMVQNLASKDLPIVRIHADPLVDEEGIFGFRMEELFPIDVEGAAKYSSEITKAIREINRHGVVHYDIQPCNIMQNKEGLITIIDFGRAGFVGQVIPAERIVGFPTSDEPEKEIYTIESDLKSLKWVLSYFENKGSFVLSRPES
ncbi:MAG: hypothetical protein M1825_000276 [Sarcosagium campestre]|nr:MAG: hypothetical protein M1825_000276 [Sarcosagium campestre]